MSDKLRECPFCGEEVKMRFPCLHRYDINCSNCGIRMWDDTESKLIKAWNTRHEPKHETVEKKLSIAISAFQKILDSDVQPYDFIYATLEKIENVANHHGKPEEV